MVQRRHRHNDWVTGLVGNATASAQVCSCQGGGAAQRSHNARLSGEASACAGGSPGLDQQLPSSVVPPSVVTVQPHHAVPPRHSQMRQAGVQAVHADGTRRPALRPDIEDSHEEGGWKGLPAAGTQHKREARGTGRRALGARRRCCTAAHPSLNAGVARSADDAGRPACGALALPARSPRLAPSAALPAADTPPAPTRVPSPPGPPWRPRGLPRLGQRRARRPARASAPPLHR